ncbi:MAG TPA: YjgP/YjgQ family permease [Firmicutes bacterium]|nr:YjgP/YjgQ family permease [Bacillota bacterium]
MYLLREFIGPFLLCIGGFTLIILSGQLFWLADLIIVKKVAAAIVLRLLVYKLPDVVVQSLPVATLFACLLTLSRLARDGELAAIRIGGMRFGRVMLPFLLAAIAVSAATFGLSEWVVPWTNHESENIVRKIVLEETMPDLKEDVFVRGTGNRFFYVQKVDPRTHLMQNVMVYELEPGKLPRMITAKRARGSGNVWRLEDGVVHDLDEDGYVTYEVKFDEMTMRMETGVENFFENQKTPQEMSRRELKDTIDLFKKSGVNVDALIVDYQLKLSLPLAALMFMLVGAPLGIKHPRSGRLFGAVVSGVTAFTYYVISSLLRSFGCNSLIPPLVAAWVPNILFASLGAILIVRSDRV